MKHWVLWSIALRNVARFWRRSLSLAIPLFVVMALAAGMSAVHDGLLEDARASAEGLPPLTVRRLLAGRMVPMRPGALVEIEGIRQQRARIWGQVELFTNAGRRTCTLVGLEGQSPVQPIVQGRAPGPREVVVGKILATQAGVRPGEKLALIDAKGVAAEFRLVGLFSDRSRLWSSDLILTDLESARAVLGYDPGTCTDVWVDADEEVGTTIEVMHPELTVLTRAAQRDKLEATYGGRAGVFQLMWLILLLTVLLLAWAQASSISLEMHREVGVLKALGWPTLDIIEVKMLEALVVGLAAVASGVLAGLAFVLLGAPILRGYMLGGTTPFPVPCHLGVGSLFVLFAIGLAPLCGATIFPAWRLATLEPDRAIRSQ